MSDRIPTLSIGLAVRNGRRVIERCIDSILSQDFTDFELVICDNLSDDGTNETLKCYAQADRRIRLGLNSVNVGSHENMALVLNRSRGTYFRWISADDWLEPGCLSKCVDALERNPDAIGVTTGFTIRMHDGKSRFEDYPGSFPASPDPVQRLDRMLWFLHAGDVKYDPVYGMYRRRQLIECRPLRPSERTDWLLSVALALKAPIMHLPERLANRTRDYPVRPDRVAFRRRLDPARAEQIRTSPRRLHRQMLAIAVSEDLTEAQLRRCRPALRRFWIKEVVRSVRNSLSDSYHGMKLMGRRWAGVRRLSAVLSSTWDSKRDHRRAHNQAD